MSKGQWWSADVSGRWYAVFADRQERAEAALLSAARLHTGKRGVSLGGMVYPAGQYLSSAGAYRAVEGSFEVSEYGYWTRDYRGVS